MIKPSALQKGDTVAIIATARKISREELDFAIQVFEGWGLKVHLSENLFSIENQFAGSDVQRARDLNAAIQNQEIKAIIGARGGYGTVRIVDAIDFNALRQNPKWIMGYSDITVLHNECNNYGISSLHSTMPINFSKNEEALESMRKFLFGERVNYNFSSHELNRKGEVCAELVGGNLSLIYALSGTSSDLHTENKILFLEDLDEYLYHIDRMMMNLKRSGKLSQLKGLLVGGLTEMKDNAIPFGKSAEEIVREAVNEYDFPVAFGFPAGHVDRNLALSLGSNVLLKVDEKCSLEFL
jgi:muramoyltetrapeptide carboxypeptidase